MADTAYDADHLRQAIAAQGAIAVIPNNPSRALKHPLDKHLYAQRHLVECCFSKLKQFRRVATRFEKTARNYQAVVTLAAITLSMRSASTLSIRVWGAAVVLPQSAFLYSTALAWARGCIHLILHGHTPRLSYRAREASVSGLGIGSGRFSGQSGLRLRLGANTL